jgi:hypothetical protein
MTIIQALRAYLAAETIDNVFCVVFPDDVELPAVRLQQIGGAPIVHLDGDSGEARARIQVSCFASTYQEAKNTAEMAKAALSAYRGAFGDLSDAQTLITNETDLYEPSTRLHHIALDVDVIATTT